MKFKVGDIVTCWTMRDLGWQGNSERLTSYWRGKQFKITSIENNFKDQTIAAIPENDPMNVFFFSEKDLTVPEWAKTELYKALQGDSNEF